MLALESNQKVAGRRKMAFPHFKGQKRFTPKLALLGRQIQKFVANLLVLLALFECDKFFEERKIFPVLDFKLRGDSNRG